MGLPIGEIPSGREARVGVNIYGTSYQISPVENPHFRELMISGGLVLA